MDARRHWESRGTFPVGGVQDEGPTTPPLPRCAARYGDEGSVMGGMNEPRRTSSSFSTPQEDSQSHQGKRRAREQAQKRSKVSKTDFAQGTTPHDHRHRPLPGIHRARRNRPHEVLTYLPGAEMVICAEQTGPWSTTIRPGAPGG